MKYIDFAIQTLILAGLLVAAALFGQDSGWVWVAIFGQLAIGPWQLASSMLSVAFGSGAQRWKLWHLGISVAYLVLLYLSVVFDLNDHLAWFFFATVPGWALASFYYVITCKLAFAKKHVGHFLPHLGF